MKKCLLFILLAISLILTACGGGNSTSASGYGAPVQIGTLPNGSAVYLSKNNLPVSDGNPAQVTIYLEGGSSSESFAISFTTTQQLQATLRTKYIESYGISVSTIPTPCIIGTADSGAPTQCQVTVTSSVETYAGTYLITPTATPVSGGVATILSPLTILLSGPITPSTKALTSFSLNGTSGVITGQNIAVTMPSGTNLTSLIATYITTGSWVSIGSIRQDNGITHNDFTNPVVYTVHAADGTTQDYTVTVTTASPTASITVTPGVLNPSPSAGEYFIVSLSLVGNVNNNQTISISNRSALQALGVLAVSNQNANLNSCILNNTTTNCVFNVVISGSTQANATPPQLMFSNSATATLNPTSLSYTLSAPQTSFMMLQLPQTGQTAIYSAYDDGNFLIGYPWVNNAASPTTPVTRFTDDGCEVTDHLTGLTWLKDPTVASASALTWTNSLTTANAGTWCGKSAGTWRVPNVNELFSLVNFGESSGVNWLNSATGHFNSITAVNYWSSSTRASNTSYKWYVTINTGKIGNSQTSGDTNWLLPVRGTTSGLSSIPQTGETTTVPLDPAPVGSDGNLTKGTVWPNPRFTQGTGATANCITDNLTGLTWLRDGSLANGGSTLNWESAINIARNGSWCGYSDWRLPNIREIMSLINYSQQYTTWLTDAGFVNLATTLYWSSTTMPSNSTKAWTGSPKNGYNSEQTKTSASSYMLPVRGGVGAAG